MCGRKYGSQILFFVIYFHYMVFYLCLKDFGGQLLNDFLITVKETKSILRMTPGEE